MDKYLEPPAAKPLVPISNMERIQALDVVRGFALIGIFIMNVEFFNRAIGELGQGIQLGLTGIDWWVSYIVAYFVAGKFWTIFSLLFGMGFAVMLTRAETAQRDFMVPYLRRIVALAIFGTLHHIFLWSGDILFSYAAGATALLIVLYGEPKYIGFGIAGLIGAGFIPGCDWSFGLAGGLAFFGVAAWFLRGERQITVFGHTMPLFAFVTLIIGMVAAIAAPVLWILPNIPEELRVMPPILSAALLAIGALMAGSPNPAETRPRRLGVGIYMFAFFMMTAGGAAQYLMPVKPVIALTPVSTVGEPATLSSASTKAGAKPEAKKTAKPEAIKTEAEKAAERQAERVKDRKERQDRIRNEVRVLSHGTYLDAVRMRAIEFAKHAPREVGFATILIGMFLLGFWFVRAGLMQNTAAHLPLFRKLALYGLPLGIGLGLLGSMIATHRTIGLENDGFQFAHGLLMLGNLPASLGYVGLVIVMLHSATAFSKIRVLAPFGRMALTNYLMQSLVASLFFFGYGFGHWGLGRAWQMVFVVVVLCLQIPFSHWWLARFRFGPVEWLWRAITYWQLPAMRLAPPGLSAVLPHAG